MGAAKTPDLFGYRKPKAKRRPKVRVVEVTVVDRLVVYVVAHNRREARNKIRTVRELNRHIRSGGKYLRSSRTLVPYHLPLTLGD